MQKKYSYDYDDVEDRGKGTGTMVADILADPEFAQVDDLVIGSWGDSYETSAEKILEDIIANKEKFSHVTKLFVGDMDYEECEVSWIIQGNYEALFAAMPQLESLTIKGSTDLQLGQVVHPNLKSLTIICGGLPRDVIASIRDAKLPALENLVLYLGVEDYGFDGSVKDIAALLERSDFPKLRSLGICDSEIQDEVTKLVLESKYIDQLHVLDLSQGTLTDEGGKLLLAQLPAHSGIQKLDLQYHFLSDEMMEKLAALPIDVNVEEQNEPDEYDGDLYYYPCLTE